MLAMSAIQKHCKMIQYQAFTLIAFIVLFVYATPSVTLRVLSLAGLFACSLLIVKKLCALIFLLPDRANKLLLSMGFIVMIGGASFDIINTVVFSPDLSLEGNPIARSLLDSGTSVGFVYIIGAIGQSLLLIIGLLLWVFFLKSYPVILNEIRRNPKKPFLYTLWGGPNATLLRIMIGKGDPFYNISSLGPIFLGVFLHRWYLGLEWLNIVPISRIVAPSLFLIFSFCAHALFVRWAIRSEFRVGKMK